MVGANPDILYNYKPKAVPLSHTLLELLQPSTVGALGAAAAVALAPRLPDPASLGLLSPELVGRLPGPLYAGIVGFILGWGSTKSLAWLRWYLFRKLIAYHGWIRNPKSSRTKIWGVLVGLLRGSPPFSMLHFQNTVPKQPLPDLNATLDRWLSVAELLVSPEEFEYTKQAVEEFRVNEGPQLQLYLRKKAENNTSWLSDYWMSVAYLSGRLPIAVYSNFYYSNAIPKKYVSDPSVRAATSLYHMITFSELIHGNTLQPVMLRDLVPLCMYNYRFVFNAVRTPGEHMDQIDCYPGEKHVVIIRKGHYYKLDMYPAGADGKPHRLTAEELLQCIRHIRQHADALGTAAEPVAVLTSGRRDVWKKNRDLLKVKNADVLHTVESALLVLTLDDNNTVDHDELAKACLAGSGNDRWFDKSHNAIVFENCMTACNIEHSALDATVMAAYAEFVCISEEFDNGDIIKDPLHPPRQNLAMPKKLEWNVKDMTDIIKEASIQFKALKDNIELVTMQAPYGKGLMKKKRVSPDGYIQMAMQLAYYRLHNEVPKSYEPATNRMFALGRTETVHPISKHSIEWVKCMDDPDVPADKKISLVKAAIKVQSEFRVSATMGKACDRHLLGLFCASRELGMDVPKLFMDRAWQTPFKLSTSQTPNMIYDAGLDCDWRDCSGGFGPVCEDGYGICYVILGEDILNLHITSWNSCETTSAKKLAAEITKAFEDMKILL